MACCGRAYCLSWATSACPWTPCSIRPGAAASTAAACIWWAAGPAALCAEGTGDKTLLVKELIGSSEAVDQIAAVLPQLLPKFGGTYRTLGDSVPFGMMKWLSPELDQAWDRDIRAYLGLAFD